jgi:Zn-dependent protease with chaperone function
MPILVTLFLLATILPFDWPDPAFSLSPPLTLILTASLVAVSLFGSITLSASVAGAIQRDPDHRPAIARRYARWRRRLFYLNVSITLIALFAFGWGKWVWEHAVVTWGNRTFLAPFAELLVPAPYLFTLFMNWAVYWPAERALHRAAYPGRTFWTWGGYWLYQARLFFIPVLLTLLLYAGYQCVGRLFPEWVRGPYQVLFQLLGVIALSVLLPLAIKPLLGLKSLPPGPTRDRLRALAVRMNVRYTDLLLWPTHGAMANAMVIGVVPWARYIIFTDLIVEGLEPDELDAVFGHELGHARFGHLPYYLLFFLLSSAALGTGLMFASWAFAKIGWEGELPPPWSDLMVLPPLVFMGLYFFVVFGWLSRVCERQADLFGSRAGACGNPNCLGHNAGTPLAVRGLGWCPTGAGAMARALDKVMLLNGWDSRPDGPERRWHRLGKWVRAWQHGTMANRIDYLGRVADRPDLADAHDRWAFWVRVAFVLVLGVIVATGLILGGQQIWTTL